MAIYFRGELHGINSFHDFIIAKGSAMVTLKVKGQCYKGLYEVVTIRKPDFDETSNFSHCLFQLSIEHEGKTAGYWPLSKFTQKVMSTNLRSSKLILIDEVSVCRIGILHIYTCNCKNFLVVQVMNI